MKRKIKRIMAFLVAAVMIAASMGPVSPVQAASKPQFTVKTSNASPKPGETFTAELWLEPNAGLTSFALVYTFDAETFELVGKPKKGATLAEMDMGMLMYDEADPGEVSIIADWDTVADMEGGQMCILTLKVKDNASGSGKIAVAGATGTAPDPNGGEDLPIQTESIATKVEDKDGNEIQGGQLPINIELQSISLNKTAPFTMEKGASETLTVTAKPANALEGKKVEWTSSNPKVVTVDANGTVKAVGGGTAKVTAKVGGKTASVDITVNVPLTSIKLNQDAFTLLKGAEQTLEVIYTPADTNSDKTVTWTSSNPSVAVVDATGKVTGVKAGTADITATVKGGFTAKCTVTVEEIPLTGIELGKETPTEMYKGANIKIQVNLLPANTTDDVELLYTSSDETVAVVSKDGVVKGLGKGTVDITVQTADGRFTQVFTLKVTEIPLEGIAFKKIVGTLEEGQTAKLEILYHPDNTTDDRAVTWSSSDESVATVAGGQVTAHKAGKTTITARVGDKEVSYELVVVKKKVPPQENNEGTQTPSSQKPSSPKTGDTANVFSIMLVSVLSFLGAAWIMTFRNKARKTFR